MSSNITEIAIFQPRPIVQTVYVNQTITKYINQTVYVPEYINRTVYVPEYINRTVNIPYIPWWVWLILVVAVVEAFIIIGLSLREGRKEKREEEKKEKASSFSDETKGKTSF
jgi:beta-lactamase regulating signal transducer with metallopeptidase domain